LTPTDTQRDQLYEEVQKEGLEGRSLDAMVLLKAAHRLEAMLMQWDSIDSREGMESLADALRYNQRLWTLYQTELSSPNHPLPMEVRRNLLVLSDYIDRATMRLLAAPERPRIRALIDIDRQLAEGLSARPAPGRGHDTASLHKEEQGLDLDL
jgi:flagellar protein FlaF